MSMIHATSAMDKLKILLSVLLLFSFSLSGFGQTAGGRSRVTNVDLLIVGGTIVTMNSKREVIENGAVGIKNDKIVMVGTRADAGKPSVNLER